ncbi:MarR family transcriptional regulator (plasmid) [Sarcina sp. JB2]|uniref:MarR family transcriptional regulator n=1 Tax=Candidatus Sarcina troglodytae TaxID=2726954 RepID=A0ACD1BGD1_9CLOT|nr:MarR family transcriptional regulator [Sarcina sp. JB2]QPJ86609.1 MarR family transcriptional regulator [Sarcina sp. JB2]
MGDDFFEKFAELCEKQDILTELNTVDDLKGYNYSEVHCIDAIGKLEHPNVVNIAKKLNMTKSAISKITKKQIAKGLIVSYKLETNKKEVYFKFTDKGKKLFIEHNKRHENWINSQKQFLQTQSKETLIMVNKFLDDFNNYLKNKIEQIDKKGE